jgi:hypothetical protein
MLTGAPGALVKESNVETITLELVLSTPQKYKKCYFYFKISIFSSRPRALVNMTLYIMVLPEGSLPMRVIVFSSLRWPRPLMRIYIDCWERSGEGALICCILFLTLPYN